MNDNNYTIYITMSRPYFMQNILGAYDQGFSKSEITPTLSIGDVTSSYEPFQVIVNANYPYNNIQHKMCERRIEIIKKTECTLYLVGLCDHDSEIDNLLDCIEYLIPQLRSSYHENTGYKFLFHCYAGKSRSVALALAFMVEVIGMKFDNAFELVREKRSIVEPRSLFIETLREKYKDWK